MFHINWIDINTRKRQINFSIRLNLKVSSYFTKIMLPLLIWPKVISSAVSIHVYMLSRNIQIQIQILYLQIYGFTHYFIKIFAEGTYLIFIKLTVNKWKLHLNSENVHISKFVFKSRTERIFYKGKTKCFCRDQVPTINVDKVKIVEKAKVIFHLFPKVVFRAKIFTRP